MVEMNQIIADYNSLEFESFMNDEEKWYFDTYGYIIVRNVLSRKDADYLVEKFEEWIKLPKDKVPAPMNRSLDNSVVQNMHYIEKKYQDLILEPRIMKYVSSILLHNPRLMFCSMIRSKKDDKRKKHSNKKFEKQLQKLLQNGNILLHRDTNGYNYPYEKFVNPLIGYQVINGIIHSGYVNVSITLVDVPGDHGIGLIPGSHKSNFNTPKIKTNDPYKEYIQSFELSAGDAIVFVPNLLHTTRKWKMDYPRYTVFNRYVFGKYIEEGFRNHSFEEYKGNLSEELYELEQMNLIKEKKIVKRLKKIYT
tara:strand:+ start:251 stop:1171 length:921 start_codon:yes stop_codon:yes gene_type:complete